MQGAACGQEILAAAAPAGCCGAALAARTQQHPSWQLRPQQLALLPG